MAVSVTLSVTDDVLPVGNPLEAVVVHVYSEDGITFVTEGDTDENGKVVFLLPDLTNYWVRFFKWEYGFQTRLRIQVDGEATYGVVGVDLVARPPSTVPELCRASGTVVNVSGQPCGSAMFRFDATRLPDVVAGRAIVSSSVTVWSDNWGYVEVELVQGGVYDVTVTGHEDTPYRIKVPDTQSVNISDLVWPFVAELVYDVPNPLNISVGDVVEILPSVVLSSGVRTPFELDDDDMRYYSYYIRYDEIDTAGAVSWSHDWTSDKLTITGELPGTTTFTPVLLDDREARRLPAPAREMQSLIIVVS